MKLPRNLSGDELIRALTRLGYVIVRQAGSHVRLSINTQSGERHLTVPKHKAIKVGTLSSILGDVSDHLGIAFDDLLERLFS